MAVRQELGQCFDVGSNYRGISIPLFWTVLDEKGCSDNLERREILELFIDEFGAVSIRFVTADREFASKDWLAYLNQVASYEKFLF